MATLEPAATAHVGDDDISYIQWTPAVAGALAAAAIAFVLHSFAAAIGIAVSSAAPTWRDASMALQILSGVYLVLVAIAAFGVGGYIAGRMRTPIVASSDEVEFRDGTHGLLVWAIALVLTVLMTWATAQSLTRLSAPSGGPSGTAQSVAGENVIAFDLDRLFRTDKRPQNIDLTYARSEAARILLTAAGHSGISSDDRSYLVRLTAATTGLAQPESEKRVDTIITQARDNIRRARRSAVILAFMAGAAALLGIAVAWFSACAGGRHRDNGTAPSMTWGWTGPRLP
jgi:hypothetical protein